MTVLTKEEREKFATYLEESAQQDEGLVDQMKKINTPEALIKYRLVEVHAAKIVAKKLRSWEEW